MSIAWDFKREVERQQKAVEAEKVLESKDSEQIAKLAEDQGKYDLLIVDLEKDLKRLSSFPTGEERTKLKRDEFIPKYMPRVKGYIDNGEIYKNALITQVMIWLFDVGNIDEALKLSDLAIAQKQSMPKRFKSSVYNFTADAVLEWANYQKATNGSIHPYFEIVYENVKKWSVHEDVKIKYHKAAAKEAEEEGNITHAYELYKTANEINPLKAKVKTKLEKLKKKLDVNQEKEVNQPPVE